MIDRFRDEVVHPRAEHAIPDSVVRVETDSGLGSGVLISDHVILTAAYVVEHDKDGIVDIKTEDGGLFMGEVLWQSKQYDVAAIRVEKIEGIKPSPLAAENPKIGDEVVVSGNPLGHPFFRSWGHVSGSMEATGPWKQVIPVDVTIAPGNSGGPAFNAKGEVVGLMVGILTFPIGFGATFTGFTTMVPVSAIHPMLGNA